MDKKVYSELQVSDQPNNPQAKESDELNNPQTNESDQPNNPQAKESGQLDNINQLPIELLESIFQHLDEITSLLKARLTCRLWNTEILSHGPLKITLNDVSPENLLFLRKINTPYKLTIRRLENKESVTFLLKHALAKLSLLQFSPYIICQSLRSPSQRFQLKFFSDYATNITALLFRKPALACCDLEQSETTRTPIQPRSIFPNLEQLHLTEYESYKTVLRPRDVELTSKNICYLLKLIASTQVRILVINLNTRYLDINCCRGRLSHRFEAEVLPEFLCRQPKLQELYMDIPPSNSKWLPKLKDLQYPGKLTVISSHTASGSKGHKLLSNIIHTIEIAPAYFTFNSAFYNSLDQPENSEFWKQLLLHQSELENIYFLHSSNFGSADFIPKVLQNNWTQLKQAVIMAKFTGELDCELFKGHQVLEVLCIWNHVFRELTPAGLFAADEDAPPCYLIGIKYLPTKLRVLSLRNITISMDEFRDLDNSCGQLTQFGLVNEYHYLGWESEEFVDDIMAMLIRRRELRYLYVGYIPPGMENILEKYKHWIEQDHGEPGPVIKIYKRGTRLNMGLHHQNFM